MSDVILNALPFDLTAFPDDASKAALARALGFEAERKPGGAWSLWHNGEHVITERGAVVTTFLLGAEYALRELT